MKIARFCSAIFGVLGAAVMVFSIGLCLLSLNWEPVLKETPKGAVECAEALMEAFAAGDYTAASQRIYGQPDLGGDRDSTDAAAAVIWEAFRNSLDYEFRGDCYAADSGICRDVSVTFLKISSVTGAVSRHAHALMTAEVEAAQTMEELYDESGNFREALVSEVLEQAVEKALEDGETVTMDLTLTLIHRDGAWWAAPNETLLTALSGGMA